MMDNINTLLGSLLARTGTPRRPETANPGTFSLNPNGGVQALGLEAPSADRATFGGQAHGRYR